MLRHIKKGRKSKKTIIEKNWLKLLYTSNRFWTIHEARVIVMQCMPTMVGEKHLLVDIIVEYDLHGVIEKMPKKKSIVSTLRSHTYSQSP